MATIEDVYSLLAENGAIVKFTNDSQLAPLRSMLSEVLGKSNASLNEGNKKSNKLLSESGKSRDKLLKSMNKGLDNVEKAVKEQKGGMLGFLKSGNLWMNAGKMLLGAASMLIDYGKQYYGNLKKLSDAGVRISEGFDRAFGAYAAVADMSHENFAKLLIQNKRFVTRMNSVAESTTSGSRLIAEMAAKLNGRFALDEEQTGTILEFFGEITNTMSRRKLTDNYLINQSEILGQTMKGLSAAVGMSIEQFKEKVKQDEQDLAERRIMRDSRTRGRYMLNKAAMGKDAALYLETGIPNEKVLNMMANPAQQAFFQNMMQANQKTNSENKEEMIEYAKVYESNMRRYVDGVRENFDKQQAGFLGLAGEWGQGQFGSMNFQDISPEMMAKAMDESDLENKTVDGINMLNRTVDVIKDLLVYQVFKGTGKSIGEAFKYANQGSDAIKKFILGDDYKKFDAEAKGWDTEKIKELKKIASNDKIFGNYSKEERDKAAKELTEIAHSQIKRYAKEGKLDNFTGDLMKYADLSSRLGEDGKIYINGRGLRINKNDKEDFNRFMDAYQRSKYGRTNFWGTQIQDAESGENIMSTNEYVELGKKFGFGYSKNNMKPSEQAFLQKSLMDAGLDIEELYISREKIGEKEIMQVFKNIDGHLVNILDENKKIHTNTEKQAEGINEANNIQKSNAADSSYNNMVTSGPFAIPAY